MIRAIIVGVVVGIIVLITSGCAAVPAAAGYLTSGGVTLYKSAKESGPTIELVVLKLQPTHIVYQCPPTK